MPVGSYIARIIYEYLSNSGITVCYDVESFQLAGNYRDATSQILDQIRCFILILTPDLLTRCVNNPDDDVYRELKLAAYRYETEHDKSSPIPNQNKFRFIPIIPDSLFDFGKHIPNKIDPKIRDLLDITASEIHFCNRGFHDDINRELLSLIVTTLSSNSIDQINNKSHERKRDLIDSDLSIQKTFIGRLIEKFL